VRVGIHELVALQPAHPPPGILGQGVEGLPALRRHLLELALLLRRDLALLAALARVGEATLHALALGLEDVVQLLLDVLQGGAEVVALELLLPPLAELVDEVLEAGHLRPLLGLRALLEETAQRAPEVAVRHDVVGHGLQEVVGVRVGDVLRAVPARVAEEHGPAPTGPGTGSGRRGCPC
jgi:hypothetical protein